MTMCLLLLILAMPGRAEDLEVSVAANSMTTEEWSSWAGASITWSEPSTKYSTMLQVQALADFLRKELSNETRTFVTTFPAPPLWKETDGAAVTLPLITKLMLWKTNGKLYQSPARVHTNACASCVYLGLTSTVSTGACWTTKTESFTYTTATPLPAMAAAPEGTVSGLRTGRGSVTYAPGSGSRARLEAEILRPQR